MDAELRSILGVSTEFPAIATTLAVTSPNWSGLSGDSAWLYHDGKKNINSHIDGYSVCPKKIETDKFCKLLKLKKN